MFVETYVPPFKRLAARLAKQPRAAFFTEMLCLLVEAVAVNGGFDESWYLAFYPDIAPELSRGSLASGFDHYCRYGILESRRPRQFRVDEAWYRRQYADVRSGIGSGAMVSGEAHYNQFGWVEGRSPSPALLPQVTRWNNLLISND